MRFRIFRNKNITTDQEDKPFMIESLIFILLMAACACGLIYAIVKLVMYIYGSVNVNTLP